MGRMFISLVLVMPRPNKNFGIDFTPRNAACRKRTSKPIESQSAGRLKRSFPECSNSGRKSDVTARTVQVRFVHCSLCRTGELCHPAHILGGVRTRARGTPYNVFCRYHLLAAGWGERGFLAPFQKSRQCVKSCRHRPTFRCAQRYALSFCRFQAGAKSLL